MSGPVAVDDPLDAIVVRVCREAATETGDVTDVVAAATDRLAPLLDPAHRAIVVARSIARLDGLDVLAELLADEAVDEVMVNAGRDVWVDRRGCVERVAQLPEGVIDAVLERVLAPTGKRLDRSTPIVDARLPDGARLCAVVAPIAVDGPCVAVRRHERRTFALDRFAAPDVAALLADCVRARCNLLVSGATSSGKTSLLAALIDVLPASERLVVVEDTAELAIDGRHVVRLEARPPTVDGAAGIDPVALVKTALRLRPDRLVVGEFRGDEVLAVVQAMNTGHDGSLSTCHANSAVDGLRRVETLVLQAAPAWPVAAIRWNISRSIDVVVHLARDRDGHRRVVDVVEVVESGDEPHGRPLVTDGRAVADLERRRP